MKTITTSSKSARTGAKPKDKMETYELNIPELPLRPYVNAKTGCYMKGHTPANKGKKWSEYMTKRAQKRAAKGWENLNKYRPKERPDNAGRCRKQVIAVADDGTWHIYQYIGQAAEKLGIVRENIRRCCQSNELHHINKKTGKVNTDHKYMGIRFYYETDSTWMEKING